MLLSSRQAPAAQRAGASRLLAFAAGAGPSRAAVAAPRRPAQQTLRCAAAAAEATEAAEAEAPQAATAAAPRKPSLHNQPPPHTYAVVEVGGKQMFVEPGKWYVCNRLKGVEVGDTIKLARVLALKQGEEFTVGRPYLDSVNIEAEVLEEFRGPKIVVYKMKPKKHYRRKIGHRQELTRFMVTKIE